VLAGYPLQILSWRDAAPRYGGQEGVGRSVRGWRAASREVENWQALPNRFLGGWVALGVLRGRNGVCPGAALATFFFEVVEAGA
jgi:hypothetical protein